MLKIEKINFFNQPNCYKLSNGSVEVIVTTDIGPRVMAYNFTGRENILGMLGPESFVETELGKWYVRGGHRLWHAPEAKPRTYIPDDDPVQFDIGSDSIRLLQRVESSSHIEKEMVVKLDPTGTRVSITHKLENKGLWPVELAAWGLTVMNGGGTTIIPNEPFISHSEELLPARPMVLWHYTDLSDPRWTLGKKYILLQSNPIMEVPQKIGVGNKRGWAAYLKNNTLFVKRFPYIEGVTYPDGGCNFATFTNGSFMEVESIGPLVHLEPDQSTIHIEHWYLFSGVDTGNTEDSLDACIMPLVAQTE